MVGMIDLAIRIENKMDSRGMNKDGKLVECFDKKNKK